MAIITREVKTGLFASVYKI